MNDEHGGINGQMPMPSHSCKCLNIRVAATKPKNGSQQPTAPKPPREYTLVYATEDGVNIIHPQLVLRNRTRGTPIPGSSRNARYTSLTCLVCHVLVYRVYQVVPVNVEGKEGPVLPTEAFVEEEIMKSADGWIEVHEGCTTGGDVGRLLAAPEYSTLFSMVFPSPLPPSGMSFERTKTPPPSSQQYLSHMAPAFPPPPFTPSGPIFKHIASIAVAQSNQLREAAEKDLAALVRAKVQEIEAAETVLRQQVELLWNKFREGVDRAEGEKHPITSRSPTSRHWDRSPFGDTSATLSSPTYGTPLAVRNFLPVEVPPSRLLATSPLPRVSTLSASLATSSFHHPAELDGRNSPRHLTGTAGSHVSRSPDSLRSSSSITLATRPGPANESTLLQFPRNASDQVNTAASFKFFMNIEEEMARKKRESEGHAVPGSNGNRTEPGPSSASGPDSKKNDVAKRKEQSLPELPVVQTNVKRLSSDNLSPKGKRKVTFDIQPAGVTEEVKQDSRSDDQEMVFDLENELDTTRQMPSREAIEHPVTLHSSRLANRKQTAGSKPQSPLDSVPGSSPLPSLNVVDGEPHETVDPPELVVTEDAEEYAPTPHEAEILKLVAADVPSHRGAWRVDGPAWQVFFSRTKPRGTPARDDDDTQWQPKVKHEDEDDDDASQITQTGIPGSMPITIHMRNRPKEAPLSLASYRPQPARPETTEAPRISRRDVYAERENARALDPGVLAFMLTEEDEEEVEQEVNNARSLDEHQSQSVDHGDRGRVHALKILEARSALPEPGNPWRSSLA